MIEYLLLYASLTSALFYLGSRALLTAFLWTRYPPKLARFFDCPSCTGFWWGVIATIVVPPPWYTWPFYHEWSSPIIVGLCAIVWTPIVAGLMQRGFESLGSAVPEDDDGPA